MDDASDEEAPAEEPAAMATPTPTRGDPMIMSLGSNLDTTTKSTCRVERGRGANGGKGL